MVDYEIFYYTKNNFNDIGFGCSYRNIQTLISSIKKYQIPSIHVPDIQELLKDIKPSYKEIIADGETKDLWIEPHDIAEYIKNHLDMFSLKIVYFTSAYDSKKMLNERDLSKYDLFIRIQKFDKLLDMLISHFKNSKLPVAIDNGTYSYLIAEIYDCREKFLLIDPHVTKVECALNVKDIGFIKNNFWMIYIPEYN